MKTENIKSYHLSIKELLRKANIKGKLKYLDLGQQNTRDEKTKIYIEVIEELKT